MAWCPGRCGTAAGGSRVLAQHARYGCGFGSLGSHLYGHLIGTGNDPNKLYVGYLIGAGAMIVGGLVAVFFAVDAEGKSLEDVARPLSVIGKPSEAIFRAGDHPEAT